MIKGKYVDVRPMLEDLDFKDISSVLKKYEEIHLLVEELKIRLKELEDVAKVYLNERKWKTYTDQITKIPVSLKNVEKRTVDEKMLEVILTDEQLSQVIKKKNKEVIEIVTKDKMSRLKKCVKEK